MVMAQEILVIKKYSNRRLYNVSASNYITLEDLFQIIKSGQDFIVTDAKTQEDLTHPTMIQLILEQEMKGYNLLPLEFLKQMIIFYDNPLGQTFREYMLQSITLFNKYYNNNIAPNKSVEKYMNIMQSGMQAYQDFIQKMTSGSSSNKEEPNNDDKK